MIEKKNDKNCTKKFFLAIQIKLKIWQNFAYKNILKEIEI
jgi:hypothetical protein